MKDEDRQQEVWYYAIERKKESKFQNLFWQVYI